LEKSPACFTSKKNFEKFGRNFIKIQILEIFFQEVKSASGADSLAWSGRFPGGFSMVTGKGDN
jgi:hypothetical protein